MESLDDLDLLPNLRRTTGAENCGMGVPFTEEILAARGIASDRDTVTGEVSGCG
ncbi:hypothetical protein ACFVH0_18375 [Streptomyces sp. NPDC127117]|uniref:hypothetical protein n=1 Tax=Streptomyces sp. NPDC127117 TaxID=3345368 RepID=UPI00363D71FE